MLQLSSLVEMYVDQYVEVPVPEKFKVTETKHVKTLMERSVTPEGMCLYQKLLALISYESYFSSFPYH